jgi:protein O-mannosyl-transferase
LPSSATRLKAVGPKKSKAVPENAHTTLSPQNNTAIACLLLAVATLAFYNPVAHCGFVYSDDVPYITKNVAVRAGLTWSTVKYAFTNVQGGFWHPLTWLSHALDYQLFGMNAAGHHYVSLLLHTGSVILLYLLLLEATGAAWPSLVVAALFALHPENVESVAWAAERKNVLSMFLCLAALWAYGRYAKNGGTRRYLAVVALFTAALMAKTQIITLPCVMLLWDYWPLRRMFAARTSATPSDVPSAYAPRSFAYLVKEKLPLFALAAIGSAITLWAQREASAFRTLGELSFSARLGNTLVAYVRYIAHTLWPVRLSPLYPHAFAALPLAQVAGAAALLAIVTAVVIRWRNLRYLPVGWFLFLGTLVPVIGLIQVGEQSMADRYAYLPMIGLFLMLVWPVAEVVERKRISKVWVIVPTMIVLATLGVLTYRQLGYWRDGETLWKYALSVNENNYVAHDNLAMVMDGEGRPDEAITEFRASEALHAYPPDQIVKIGLYEQRNGHFQGAIEQYRKAAQGPIDAQMRAAVLGQIGSAYIQMQDFDHAKQSYQDALQVNPNDVAALLGTGLLAERDGDFNRAVVQLNHAMKVETTDVGLLLLADALGRAGRSQEAQATEELAQRTSPDLNVARQNAAQTRLFFGYKAN